MSLRLICHVARRPVDAPAVQPRKGKSRVTNGKSYFVEHDGRGPWTRRWRDLLDQILCDLSSQDDALSEAQRQLARRCATLSIACEKLEGEAAAGHDIDLDQNGQLTDRLGRCFQRLGLKRQTSSGSAFGNSLKADTWSQQDVS